MVNKTDFRKLKKDMEKRDIRREDMIRKSRDVIKLSKKIIYSVHRKDFVTAKKLVPGIKAQVQALDKKVMKNPKLDTGIYKVAVQEMIEAVTYYEYVKTGKIPTSAQLKVDSEYYLLGMCDLSGELTRLAINTAIAGRHDEALKIKDFLTELYEEMMQFDFTGELRKKFDSIKYDLKKLESLALEISFSKK